MLNIFQKTFKLTFIFSAVITGWTSFVLLSNTSLNLEIRDVINKMYFNQKKFIYNVKDLSFLLVKDANERFIGNTKDITQLNKK